MKRAKVDQGASTDLLCAGGGAYEGPEENHQVKTSRGRSNQQHGVPTIERGQPEGVKVGGHQTQQLVRHEGL